MTPRFFDTPTMWSPTKTEPNHYVSLPFNAGSGSPWTSVGRTTPVTGSHGYANKITATTPTSPDPPNMVYAGMKGDWDDDVSLLNDDPDEDDDQLLPASTYDVLAPLLDEMYKDESEMNDDDEIVEGMDSLGLSHQAEDMADGARCGA